MTSMPSCSGEPRPASPLSEEVSMPQDQIDRVEAIRCLISPNPIAVIGASADLKKVNGRP